MVTSQQASLHAHVNTALVFGMCEVTAHLQGLVECLTLVMAGVVGLQSVFIEVDQEGGEIWRTARVPKLCHLLQQSRIRGQATIL